MVRCGDGSFRRCSPKFAAARERFEQVDARWPGVWVWVCISFSACSTESWQRGRKKPTGNWVREPFNSGTHTHMHTDNKSSASCIHPIYAHGYPVRDGRSNVCVCMWFMRKEFTLTDISFRHIYHRRHHRGVLRSRQGWGGSDSSGDANVCRKRDA